MGGLLPKPRLDSVSWAVGVQRASGTGQAQAHGALPSILLSLAFHTTPCTPHVQPSRTALNRPPSLTMYLRTNSMMRSCPRVDSDSAFCPTMSMTSDTLT